MNSLFLRTLLAGCMLTVTAFAQSTDTATVNFIGTISDITCSLQTSNITIPIGVVNRNVFSGVGTGSAWAPNQTLVSSGCNAHLVSMTFTGAADPNNRNVFAVTGGASGVGIQLDVAGGGQTAIPNSSTPVTFAPPAAGGGYSFSARYIQTAATVVGGQANSTITVMITYT